MAGWLRGAWILVGLTAMVSPAVGATAVGYGETTRPVVSGRDVSRTAQQQQGQADDTPRGQQAKALIEALQDGSPEALEALVNEHFDARFRDNFPMAQHLEILGELSEEVRAAADLDIRPVGELEFEFQVGSGDESNTYRVQLAPDPPHGIIGIAPR